MAKKKEKICVKCQKMINLHKEKYVLLGTYNAKEIMDESYFHFQCWVDYFNSKTKEKAENTLKDATKKVAGFLGGMRERAMKNSGEDGYIDFSNEIPNIEKEVKVF